jgi:microcystin-dependent protein
MSSPFVGEIQIFGFNFAPVNWALCNGQTVPITQNSALFSIVGTTYGGNGVSTFALPDLQNRLPVHSGQGPSLSNYVFGQASGASSVALTQGQLPSHTHTAGSPVAAAATTANPVGAFPAQAASGTPYAATAGATMGGTKVAAPTLGLAGSGLPHNNLMPYQCVNFCISLYGVFPTRN